MGGDSLSNQPLQVLEAEACGECVCDPRVGRPRGNSDALPTKQPPRGKTQPTFAEREVRGVLGGFVKCGWLGLSLAPR